MTLIQSTWQNLPLTTSRVAAALDHRGNADGVLGNDEVASATLDEFKELMGDIAVAAGHARADAFRIGEARAPSLVANIGGGTLMGLVLAGAASVACPPLAPLAFALGPTVGLLALADDVRVTRRNNAYADAGDRLEQAFIAAHPEHRGKLR